ncbi:MAG: hypothetical protein AVDCRST_MAG68-5089, partial [uncultured Gemmatimonadetes bacterium]
ELPSRRKGERHLRPAGRGTDVALRRLRGGAHAM